MAKAAEPITPDPDPAMHCPPGATDVILVCPIDGTQTTVPLRRLKRWADGTMTPPDECVRAMAATLHHQIKREHKRRGKTG